MQKLANIYKVRGRAEWLYKIMKREGDVVLAEMYREEGKELTETSRLNGYETFTVQKFKGGPRPDGKGMIAPKELPPSDYFWGSAGFSFGGSGMKDGTCLLRAEAKYQELLIAQVNRIAEREINAIKNQPEIPKVEEKKNTKKKKK